MSQVTSNINWTKLGGGDDWLWKEAISYLEADDIRSLYLAAKFFHPLITEYRPRHIAAKRLMVDLTWLAKNCPNVQAVVISSAAYWDIRTGIPSGIEPDIFNSLSKFRLRVVNLKGITTLKSDDLAKLNFEFVRELETPNKRQTYCGFKNRKPSELKLRNIRDENAIAKIGELRDLTSLDLEEAKLSDAGVNRLISELPNLTRFSIGFGRGNRSVTYEGLKFLKQYGSQLAELEIGNVSIEKNKLYDLLQPLSGLRLLSVAYLPIEDEALLALAERMPRLRNLTLRNTSVSAKCVQKLAGIRPEITRLDLWNINGGEALINDEFLRFTQLQALDLSHTGVPYNGVQKLSALKGLIWLNLYGLGFKERKSELKDLFPKARIYL